MRSLVESLPTQVRWAVDLEVPPVPQASEVLVCGMGGSAISGDLLATVAAAAGRRVMTHRGYGLPGWARAARPLIIALSYSGNTEETLTAVECAAEDGLDIVAVTSDGVLAQLAASAGWPHVRVPEGLPPRAALGHMLGASARLCGAAGVIPGVVDDLAEAAELTERLIDSGWTLAEDLADGLSGLVPVIYGSGITVAAATRWKTQINENAKLPAWTATFPEADHNEIVGWSGAPRLSERFGIIALRDPHESEGVSRRFDVTREVTSSQVRWVGEVWGQGGSILACLLTLTLIGDMTSVALASAIEVDPMPVEIIENLKQRMREDS